MRKRTRTRILQAILLVLLMVGITRCTMSIPLPGQTKNNPEGTPAPVETTGEPANSPEPTDVPDVTPDASGDPVAEPSPTPALLPPSEDDPARFIDINTSEKITISRHPDSKTVEKGTNAIFSVRASGADTAEWRFVSPDMKREVVWNSAEIRKEFPGLHCFYGERRTFYITDIPSQLNGWYVSCLLTDSDGGMVASRKAKIEVIADVKTTPAPARPVAPTPTPVPTYDPSTDPTLPDAQGPIIIAIDDLDPDPGMMIQNP